jgi:two-component system NtrC family sensor kinase
VSDLNDLNGDTTDIATGRERALLDLLGKASDFYEQTIGILSSIFEISEYVTRGSGEKDFFSYVTGVLIEESRCDNASIFMVEGEDVVLKAASGKRLKDANEDVRMALGRGVAGTCAKEGRPILVGDVKECDFFMKMESARVKIGSMLCVPIKEGDRTVGVMNLSHSSKGFFDIHSVRVFELLGLLVGHMLTLVHISEVFRQKNSDLNETLRARDESLRGITQRYKAVVDSTEEMICIADSSGSVLFVNHAMRRLLGGQPSVIQDIFGKAGAQVVSDRMREAVCGRSAEFDLSFRASGRDLIAQFLLVPLEAGQVLMVMRDITARRKMEQKTMQTEKLTSLGLLTSGIAHELNNKLTPILGFSELIDSRRLSAGDKKRLSVIVNAAQSAKGIVESLLKFSRNKPPEKAVFDMHDVVKRSVALYTPIVKKRSIHIVSETPETPLYVRADMNCMEQVLVNFINNAIDAIGDSPGTIWIRAWSADGYVQISVEDTGPGIPEEVMGRVFDPFFTTKPKDKGTGLGLSICYGIITDHKGDISLENTGSGARATVKIPAASVLEHEQGLEGLDTALGLSPGGHESGLIMVVEDEEDLRDLMVDTLSPFYHVMTFDNGRSAFDHLDEYSWELIISDLRMPVMNGMEFYEEAVRRNPTFRNRFMFITGDTYDYQVREFLERNNVTFLRKPFRIMELRETVSRQLQWAKTPR